MKRPLAVAILAVFAMVVIGAPLYAYNFKEYGWAVALPVSFGEVLGMLAAVGAIAWAGGVEVFE